MGTLFPFTIPSPDLIADPLLRQQLITLRENAGALALPILWSVQDKPVIRDLADINHLLIAGAQGQGKSNFIHQLLLSLLFTTPPQHLQLLLIDFKRLELCSYAPLSTHYLVTIPDLASPVVSGPVSHPLTALQSLQLEIERRVALFARTKSRNMLDYQQRLSDPGAEEASLPALPYIVVVVDELADLDLPSQKELRELLERTLSIGAKVGVIFILSTGVIPGHVVPSGILSSIEERVIFHLFERDNYRKFLHTVNFPEPLSKGAFVYRTNGQVVPGKSLLIAPTVIAQFVYHIHQQNPLSSSYMLPALPKAAPPPPMTMHLDDRDPLFEDAARLVVQNQLGSSSLIQRRMKLGYNRVGRLMDQLEAAGVIGPGMGSKPRDVLIKSEEELERYLRQ